MLMEIQGQKTVSGCKNPLGKKAKSTVKSELKLLKRFLYFAWKCSIIEIVGSVMRSMFKKPGYIFKFQAEF